MKPWQKKKLLAVGARCLAGKDCNPGVVRFYGKTQFASGDWIGVELDGAHGKNDGSVGGIRYFECTAEHGLFIKISQLDFEPKNSSSDKAASDKASSLASAANLASSSLAVEHCKITDRLSWPLAGSGIGEGPSHNMMLVGTEGSGKTSVVTTILSYLLGKLKKLGVISASLAPGSKKTDWDWCARAKNIGTEFVGIPALSHDPVKNAETLEDFFNPVHSAEHWSCLVIDDLGARLFSIMVFFDGRTMSLCEYLYP